MQACTHNIGSWAWLICSPLSCLYQRHTCTHTDNLYVGWIILLKIETNGIKKPANGIILIRTEIMQNNIRQVTNTTPTDYTPTQGLTYYDSSLALLERGTTQYSVITTSYSTHSMLFTVNIQHAKIGHQIRRKNRNTQHMKTKTVYWNVHGTAVVTRKTNKLY